MAQLEIVIYFHDTDPLKYYGKSHCAWMDRNRLSDMNQSHHQGLWRWNPFPFADTYYLIMS